MRRFLSIAVLAVLAAAVATPVHAGYLVIRVILDGAGAGAASGAGGAVGGAPPGVGGGNRPPDDPGDAAGGGSTPSPGGMMPTTPGMPSTLDPTRSVVVVVPIEEDLTRGAPFYKGVTNSMTNPTWKPKLHLNHRDQKLITNLFTDSSSIQWYENLLAVPGLRTTRATLVRERHDKWLKSRSDSKLLYEALKAALEAGMIDTAMAYADELLAFAQQKKDGLPPEVVGFSRAYAGMQKALKSPATQPSPAADWQARLDAPRLHILGHYALIYWDATGPEVERRMNMLEENFKGFFLWHATRGIALPVPERPLIAILAKRGRDVLPLAHALDAPPRMPADGFYSLDHDLLVLSPERLDDVGMTFTRQAQQIYRDGISRDRLLAGEGPPIHKEGQGGKRLPEEVARMQTMALVERLVDDEAAMCAISREGTRQLLYATGILPRYVYLPEWLSHGAVNFFTRPKDPAFVTDAEGKWLVHVATATGYGGPNYTLQRYFKDLVDKQELNPDRAALLKNVLTDAYFHGLKDAREAKDPDPAKDDKKGVALHSSGQPMMPGGGFPPGGSFPPGAGFPPGGGSFPMGPMGPMGGSSGGLPPPKGGPASTGGTSMPNQPSSGSTTELDQNTLQRKKRERLFIKAQATAWALYYYLAKDHPNELRKFLDELAALPRDLPLSGDVVVDAFCRAFSLDPSKPSLTKFANGWLEYMRDTPLVGVDIALVDPKPATSSKPPGSGEPGGTGR